MAYHIEKYVVVPTESGWQVFKEDGIVHDKKMLNNLYKNNFSTDAHYRYSLIFYLNSGMGYADMLLKAQNAIRQKMEAELEFLTNTLKSTE